MLFNGQWLLQSVLSLILFVAAIYRRQQFIGTATVAEDGQWQMAQREWRISSKSRVTSWLLWIHLVSATSGQSRWLWVFCDAVSVIDYRRLCRIILAKSHPQAQSKEDINAPV